MTTGGNKIFLGRVRWSIVPPGGSGPNRKESVCVMGASECWSILGSGPGLCGLFGSGCVWMDACTLSGVNKCESMWEPLDFCRCNQSGGWILHEASQKSYRISVEAHPLLSAMILSQFIICTALWLLKDPSLNCSQAGSLGNKSVLDQINRVFSRVNRSHQPYQFLITYVNVLSDDALIITKWEM